MRLIFRSRWAALAWSVLICVRAAEFAGSHAAVSVNAANSVDSATAQASALSAEDPD